MKVNEKDIKIVWKHVIDGKAVAISPSGCSVIGEAARWIMPLGTWKIAYLDKIATYYMVDGEVIGRSHNAAGQTVTMKHISIDNGNSWTTPEAAIAALGLDAIVNYMDDDTRETVHSELAPCTDVEFLREYLRRAPADLIIG